MPAPDGIDLLGLLVCSCPRAEHEAVFWARDAQGFICGSCALACPLCKTIVNDLEPCGVCQIAGCALCFTTCSGCDDAFCKGDLSEYDSANGPVTVCPSCGDTCNVCEMWVEDGELGSCDGCEEDVCHSCYRCCSNCGMAVCSGCIPFSSCPGCTEGTCETFLCLSCRD